LAPIAAREAGKFSEEVPQVIDRLGELPIVGGTLTRQHVPDRLRDWATRLPEQLNQNDAPVLGLFQSAVGGFVAASAVVSLTAAVLLDGRRLLEALRRAVPDARRPLFDTSAHILYRTVGRYFAGSLLVSLLAATGVLIVGLLVGIPLAPLVAVWVSVTNLIPQIGGFLGGAAFVLTGLSAGPTAGAICLVWFLAYQQLENHVISPLVVGEAVDLSPPMTMIGALVGAATAGVPGALVAVPLIGTVKAVFAEVRGYRGRSSNDAGLNAQPGRSSRGGRRPGLVGRLRRAGASHR
jgi:predicted PurR-regulated permease PerM